jgi:hypothetical protein
MTVRQLGHRYYSAMHNVLHESDIAFKPMYTALAARHVAIGSRLLDSTKLDKAIKLSNAVALEAGSASVIMSRERYFLQAQFELPNDYWRSFTRADIAANEIGVSQISQTRGNKTVKFELLDGRPHSLFAGATGSGKTEAIKSSLVALMHTYTPDKLGIGIADVKRDKFSPFENTAHMIAPIARDSQDITNLIAWFGSEFAKRQRNSQFVTTGIKRLLLVLDECQDGQVIGVDKNFNDHNREVIYKLVTQGREYGMYVLIGTQKPSRANLPDILDNLDNRYIGKVVDAKASANATGLPGANAHMLTAQGDFLYVPDAFNIVRFQVAMATVADYDALPRVETVAMPTTECETAVFNIPDKKVGRPQKCAIPETVARYLLTGPQNVSLSVAKEQFGLTRTEHERNRSFATRLLKEINRLREIKRSIENG